MQFFLLLGLVFSMAAAHEIWGEDFDSSGLPLKTCSDKDFPIDYNGKQMGGLKSYGSATDEAACLAACCANDKCQVYQWITKGAADGLVPGCWLGREGKVIGSGHNIISRGRGSPPPTPPPPPPAPSGPYTVDDTPGMGLRWEGVGAISGGGATSKLLMDYDPKVASDILDFMFKPNVGLDLDILKVEMGGDTDSTEGAEPSHMHAKGDANYNRGYEWWLMKEAKARKPNIKLYGLPWGFPGWLDPNAGPSTEAKNPFANPNTTAAYTLAFLEHAKTVHGLTMDYMGQWNERNAPGSYATALRRLVGNSKVLDGSTTVLNRLPHYPGTGSQMDGKGCSDKVWNSTDGRYWVDEEGSIFDGRSARCLARCINRQYATGCHTATFQWHLISSFYDYLPWSRCGVAVANEPWSGNYEITSPTWAIAHTTQFADPGWRYTQHTQGVTLLSHGGSMVTRVSPDYKDFSIVLEKMSTGNSKCARGSNPNINVEAEDVELILKGRLLAAAKREGGLRVWYSNMASDNKEGINPPPDQVFQKRTLIPVGDDGKVHITLQPEEVWTLTTLSTGAKGGDAAAPAEKSPFPLPFTQTFDDEMAPSPAKYWYDQMGAWEIAPEAHDGFSNTTNQVLRQVSPVWPACWGYSCTGPLTYFGPKSFNYSAGLTASIDIKLEADTAFNLVTDGGGAGVKLDSRDGTFSLKGGSHGKAVTGKVDFKKGTWHTLVMKMKPGQSNAFGSDTISASLDGKDLGQTPISDHGFAFKMSLDTYVYAQVDNWRLSQTA